MIETQKTETESYRTVFPFTVESITGLEWMKHVTRTTTNGVYNVDVTWALDHYRIEVRRVAGEIVLRRCKAFRLHTAMQRANKLLRFWDAR